MSRIDKNSPLLPSTGAEPLEPLPQRTVKVEVTQQKDRAPELRAHAEKLQQSQYVNPEQRKPPTQREAAKLAKKENRSADMQDLHEFLIGLPWKNQGFTEREIGTFVPFPGQDPILGNGVLPEEVMQGISNCYWAASLKAVLRRDPNFINDKVRQLTPTEVANWRDKDSGGRLDPSKKWYEATLYPRGFLGLREKAVKVLVNDEMPVGQDGSRLHLTRGATLTEDIKKTFLYEKAFAQWSGGYDALAWGNAGKALANMTGESSQYALLPKVNENALFRRIERRAERGDAMVVVAFDLADYLDYSDIGEKDSGPSGNAKANQGKKKVKSKKSLSDRVEKVHTGDAATRNRIVNKHCYAVIGVKKVEDPNNPGHTKKVVVLQDPHYKVEPFEMDFSEFKQTFLLMVSNRIESRNYDDLYSDVSSQQTAENELNVGRYRSVLA